MIRVKCIFPLLFLLAAVLLSAQDPQFIRGKIIDKETKEPLTAYVTIEGSDSGRTAGYDGIFSLKIPALERGQSLRLIIYLIGYKKTFINARPDEFITVELDLEPLDFHEVTVSADSVVSNSKVKNTVTLYKMDIYKLPGTAADPIYASQILPGVNSFPDSSTMLIRGGSPEEVAYFFDGIEIEHPFLSESLHESYFSIFDNQIVEGFNVSSSGFHPRFGDALSGIMDITAKDSPFQNEGGIGLSIMGGMGYIGLPIKNTGSFVGSYNTGHSCLMTRINNRDDSEFKTQNGFAKLNIKLNKSHTFRVLGLFDTYAFSHADGFMTDSKNIITGLSLTSSLRKNLVSRLLLSRINYQSSFEQTNVFEKQMDDTIIQARGDISLDLNNQYIEFGADIQHRNIKVTFAEAGETSENYPARGTRLGFYVNDKFRITDKLHASLGTRLLALRPYSGRLQFDPRISLAYLFSRKDTLRISAGSYHQFSDYYSLQENPHLKPKNAAQFSLSYDRNTKNTDLRFTLYNKEYHNLLLTPTNDKISSDGYGYARGVEFFLKWTKEKFDTLLVYNFLNSKRKEKEVNELVRSPYEIDHSFTWILTLKFKDSSLGLRCSFATGLPFTPLLDREWDGANQNYLPVWGEPYSQRFPSYQRLDLNGSKTFALKKKAVVLYFGITNLLNSKNILRYEYSGEYSIRNNQYSIFGRSIFIGVYVPFF